MKFPGILGLLLFVAAPAWADNSYERALRAAELIGVGRSGACSSCHATNSEQTLRRWSLSYDQIQQTCIENQSLNAKERLYCLSGQKTDEVFNLRPVTLGFWSAGLHLEPMNQILIDALGADGAKALQEKLRNTTTMPLRAPQLLTQQEFHQIRNWIDDGMPYLSEILSPYSGPTQCESFMDPKVKDHLLAMHHFGWRQKNQDNGLFMFGCSPGQGNCFRQQKDGKDIFTEVGTLSAMAAWKAEPTAELRLLTDLSAQTEYWIRSSADGRFIAYGGDPSGIVDLQSRLTRPDTLRTIPVDAFYDPAFFPDDSAFVFQGSSTALCATSLLKNPATNHIDFSEDACTVSDETDIPLYQAVGASLDGADYLAVTGEFRSDEGPDPGFRDGPRSSLRLQTLQYDGMKWKERGAQTFDSAWEKDWDVAPSNQLLISRLEGRIDNNLKHIAYQLYQLKRESAPNADPLYSKELVGRLCFDGLKVGMSYDDRFVVSYSYIKPDQWALLGYASPDDPEFKARLNAGTANIFLFDLLTQKLQTLTHMGPDQFALFPHFRSDGWIYFMTYDATTGKRRLMTANNALLRELEAPL